ncbi:MAG: heme lyase CcmF/NrfE family subunit [Chloroflexi bacterium]|nr:heme lyase CcmF/NrfE family subunit [Chloroflexota bacterium]MBF6606820.1 heme lyase CcmF/NrfE family subunit [Chloroflexota bacterium]
MIGSAGLTASLAGFVLAVLGLVVALRAVRSGSFDPSLRRFVFATAALAIGANVIMVVALVVHDFSVVYVAQVGGRETPLLYTIASLWGALEGSILFWAGLLASLTALLVLRTAARDEGRLPPALAVLFGLLVFFLGIVVGPGNPWGRVSPVPADGPGPNPLLQNNPLMVVHPPLLYLGLVGLAIPFALTISALVRGELDRPWLAATRRWTLGAWVALSMGLVLGAWWSYAVLGWGGYWAWDPVENVALLPWLTATAFLHSAMVQARRGSLAAWNVALVVASFSLTLVATLITRSGILSSVHSFTNTPIGPLFLALVGGAVTGSVLLAVWRLPGGPPGGALGARGVAFLVNNLLLVAIAMTVLVGTLFPLFVEAATGRQVSVGAPYFERVIGPIALGLLVLAGIGPSLPWGSWTPAARRRLVPGAITGVGLAIGDLLVGGPPELILGVAIGGFALVQSTSYLVDLARRRRPPRGVRTNPATWFSWPPRRVGALLSHAGIALVALVIVAAAAGRQDATATLRDGQTLDLGAYHVELARISSEVRPDRSIVRAAVHVGGPGLDQLVTSDLSLFPNSAQTIATPAIVPGLTTDVYLVLLDVDPLAGTASLRLTIQPFMSWLWVGGLLVATGGLAALAPRLTARSTRATAPDPEAVAAGATT